MTPKKTRVAHSRENKAALQQILKAEPNSKSIKICASQIASRVQLEVVLRVIESIFSSEASTD
jgi:hypothetical protein